MLQRDNGGVITSHHSVLPMDRVALALFLLAAAPAAALADTVAARCEIHPRGASKPSAVLACSFSQRQGFVSIERADGVRHELSPQEQAGHYLDALGRPAYRQRGLGSKGQIYSMANEAVHVYWDASGLTMASAASAAVAEARPGFDRLLVLQGVRFRVQSANSGSINKVRITPAGLSIDNSPQEREVDGTVVGAEVGDLDADGSPELYVYIRSAGSGAYGALLALAANRRKSLSDIVLPALERTPGATAGYQGHDEFAVGEGRLLRRFPVYKPGDNNAQPSGGWRQLQYRLTRGEASWQLVVDRQLAY